MSETAVVDASVVLKWLLDDEEHVSQAVDIRDAHLISKELALMAPELLIYEVANGLVMAARRGRMSSLEARDGLQDILNVGVELCSSAPERTLILAEQHNLTAYDAAYLAVAESEGCLFWTGDSVLHRAVRDQLPWARWVGDFRG